MTFPKILAIRADADSSIGSGHLIRCFALAQEWIRQQGEVIFITATRDASLKKMLSDEGIRVLPVSVTPGSADDAVRTTEYARDHRAQWVVIDGYHFGAEYVEKITKQGIRICLIDDNGRDVCRYADMVINQNIYAGKDLYSGCKPSAGLLLGPRYALLRQFFIKHQDNHTRSGDGRNTLLVTFGGSDADNLTQRVIDSVDGEKFSSWDVLVVISPTNKHLSRFMEAAKKPAPNVRYVFNPENMAEIIAGADLAVTGAGSTTLELLFFTVPMIVIVLADNQQGVAEVLSKRKYAVSLGTGEQAAREKIKNSLERFAEPEQCMAMARRQKGIVDGLGSERVAEALSKNLVSIRPWEQSDRRRIWTWVNEPKTRENSFFPDTIPWDDHTAWFQKRMDDKNHKGWIILTTDNKPTGSIRFDLSKTSATVSVMISRRFRNRGKGKTALRLACDEVFASSRVAEIHAFIRKENKVSVNTFSSAGFRTRDEMTIHGIPAVQLTLMKKGD